MYRGKNDNSELGIYLRTNSENSELSLWPTDNQSTLNKIYLTKNKEDQRLRIKEAAMSSFKSKISKPKISSFVIKKT